MSATRLTKELVIGQRLTPPASGSVVTPTKELYNGKPVLLFSNHQLLAVFSDDGKTNDQKIPSRHIGNPRRSGN